MRRVADRKVSTESMMRREREKEKREERMENVLHSHGIFSMNYILLLLLSSIVLAVLIHAQDGK